MGIDCRSHSPICLFHVFLSSEVPRPGLSVDEQRASHFPKKIKSLTYITSALLVFARNISVFFTHLVFFCVQLPDSQTPGHSPLRLIPGPVCERMRCGDMVSSIDHFCLLPGHPLCITTVIFHDSLLLFTRFLENTAPLAMANTVKTPTPGLLP